MKKIALIIGILCTAGVILWGISNDSFVKDAPRQTAELQNFTPGSAVNYKILSDGQTIASGQKKVLEDGTLAIPPAPKSTAQKTIEYSFSIKEPDLDEFVDLSVILDNPNQSIAFKGEGLQSFADIEIKNNGIYIQSKADWIGNFETMNPLDFDELEKEDNSTFEISFMGEGLGDFVRDRSPHIIKVIAASEQDGFATGGDAPQHSWTGGSQPNQHTAIFPPPEDGSYVGTVYNETYCGDPKLSVCEKADMAQQIQKVVENHVRALMLMTEEFSAVMMQQATMVGMFFDAKQQMDTQREMQVLVNQAHKDYHPSDQMCRFGTFIRSVADTEELGRYNKFAFNEIMFNAYTNLEHRSTSEGYGVDIESRMKQYREHHCDPNDNNLDGLKFMCDHEQDSEDGEVGAEDNARTNNDIDYTRIFEKPLTLDVDFTDGEDSESGIEEDVVALARHLYYPRAFEGDTPNEILKKYPAFQDWRSYIATQSVAHNTFSNIIAMKTAAGSDESAGTQNQDDTKGWHFMKVLLEDFGMDEDEIKELVGENPSYNAQMEILTKKIYQDPDFYTNLYDKPTNVDRISAAMDAIKLMHGRDRFEASLRREMLTSLILEQELAVHVKKTNAKIEQADSEL
ncbi:hypothetical protein N9Z27_00815 [Alphaproteobacteria bacterium]|nr:hypothetical protein [Alphaproteobacteria bacterium]